MNKKQEKEHASTLARIAKQEAAEAAKMKCGGKVKKADGGEIKSAGAGRGFVNPPRVKTNAEKEAVQDADDIKMRKKIAAMGFARGGGVELRGKTKGKFV